MAGSAVATGPIADHIDVIMNGKGQMMPAFGSMLQPAEIAAVVTYQRNGLGNSVGDMVQPSDIPAKD